MSNFEEQNKALVRGFFDAMNARRLDLFHRFLAADVVRHCAATPGVEIRSCAQFEAFMQQDGQTFPDSFQTLKQLVAEGAWATYAGTQLGAMGAIPASGKQVQFDFAAMFRVADGRIAEWWVTWDNLGILAQLGQQPGG